MPSPLLALTPNSEEIPPKDFLHGFLLNELNHIKSQLGDAYPQIFIILGNDDGRMEEPVMKEAELQGIWTYCHNRKILWEEFNIFGYSYIPPSPYRLKDWERYDVSRYVDPGCISPEKGMHSHVLSNYDLKFATIAEDLKKLVGNENVEKSIFLFHAPPYQSKLDRAALDGKMIDHVPIDVHIGSIAIQRFIHERQPLITLHGHVHESTRLTGSWKEKFNRTYSLNAAHDGKELSLVHFNPRFPEKASRELI